ncbi:SgcJ/EcaC family oxidoreductase [Nonomuraea lactucae]|uniref:SgcJ/EcaC family oxidoreductase n=1 Tax=Nonomuraea lactucae TaxID=2249762 RepID=UPI000DE33A0F|nr:SgcJ/EcaC family oxidoreductase [Nonomuraea lactucae]
MSSNDHPFTGTLLRLNAAWNDGDAAAYAAQFTPDASYVAFNGDVVHGRAEIEKAHRFLFEGPLRGSRLVDDGGTWSISAFRNTRRHPRSEGGTR